MPELSFTSLVGKITKLKGAQNYRTWAKDIELCLLRNRCWEVVSSAIPEAPDDSWQVKDNWARGEIHLCCEAEVQDIIIDSKHAHDSWTLLKSEFSIKGDLKINRLKKEFSTVVMTEQSCAEYIKRVRKLVSELRECGEKVKDADVAYTVLMGLGEKFSPLVVTLTNMSSSDSPLSLTRVSEQILTEELRLQQIGVGKSKENETHANNPLAYKSDTVFRGDLHHTTLQNAFVARTFPLQASSQYRVHPYALRGGRGRARSAHLSTTLHNISGPQTLKTLPVRGRNSIDYGHHRVGHHRMTCSVISHGQRPPGNLRVFKCLRRKMFQITGTGFAMYVDFLATLDVSAGKSILNCTQPTVSGFPNKLRCSNKYLSQIDPRRRPHHKMHLLIPTWMLNPMHW